MDKTTAMIIGLAILALAFIAFFYIFRNKGKGKISVPFGMKLEVEGSNEPTFQPGAKIKDANAGGSVRAKDSAGRGVDLEKIKAKGDIEATSTSGDLPPKK